MTEWFVIPGLLLAACGFAAEKAPSLLRWYFLSMFLSIPPQWGAAAFIGEESRYYLLVYSVVTVAILFFVLLLTLYDLTWHPTPSRMVLGCSIFALGATCITYLGVGKPSAAQWAQLAEAFVLITCSGCIGLSSQFNGEHSWRMIGMTLSIFWLLQGAFRLTFILNINNRNWLVANDVIPPLLAIAFPVLVGLQLRRMPVSGSKAIE
jgi:hypothetical protein